MLFVSKLIPLFLYLISVGSLLIDSYGSDTTTLTHFFVSSRSITLIVITLFAVLKKYKRLNLPTILKNINGYFIFPVSVIISTTLSILDYITPPNTIFAATHIQYTSLFILGIFSGIVLLLNKPNFWFQKYWKILIAFGSFLSFLTVLIVKIWPFDVFLKLSHEDNFIENMQVLVLVLGAFWSLNTAIKFIHARKYFYSALFLFVVFVLFFTAGEEVAWGQRFLHFSSPEYFLVNNAQKEITIHNLNKYGGVAQFAYIIIGGYGSFSWIIMKIFPRLATFPIQPFIPPWFASGYYFLGFIYNFYTYERIHYIGAWSEFAELMLYLGVMITTAWVYYSVKTSKNYFSAPSSKHRED
ncbi:MAG TPA: hypothetical protein VMX76_00680 [Nevskiaceae bacterium]|nr:hypothetical protein [Nevskiaceae bacterium]